jgi:hypothetical protein
VTIAIAIAVPEGLVLATDSRSTYPNPKGWPRIASENSSKLLQITGHVGACTFGWAMLSGRTIKSHMAVLSARLKETTRIEAVIPRVARYFDQEFSQHIKANPKDALPEGTAALGFLLAGYDSQVVGQVYRLLIPGTSPAVLEPEIGTDKPGFRCDGQNDIVLRLINGYDPRLTLAELPAEVQLVLGASEYLIYFSRMVLQDAIDFALFLARTTIETQRFTDGTLWDPGGIAGVGGAVEVAILTQGNGFRWIQRRSLHGETGAAMITSTYER